MKITVITVTYNGGRTLVEALDSVARQTHPDIEHIVIDGGSTDGSLALIKRHGAHIAHMVSEPDKGIYDAMNKGLRMASGELVGFLNSDDTFATDDAIEQVARAASHGRPDAVFGDLVYVDPSRSQSTVRYWRAGNFSLAKLRLGWMPPHPTLYVRRDVIGRIGPFDARLRIAADYEFMLRLLSQPGLKVAYVPKVLVRMRLGGISNQSIAAMLRKSREDLAALRKHRVGGLVTLVLKNLRKLPQFWAQPQS
ncbi:MAG: glycosyltransferase [Burkholderiaceae bacterium]|nr:glycosyltransferase [Burkholderiaceae bacterium]